MAVKAETILEAATKVFLRYGFKKTSMDDVAQAAGLSRQGLYLYFTTKEELFKEALQYRVTRTLREARAAVQRQELSLEDRLLGAFDALHGDKLDPASREHLNELIETARSLGASLVSDMEKAFVGLLEDALTEAGATAGWERLDITPKQLAEHLLATANGLKHSVPTPATYWSRMRTAVKIVTQGFRARAGRQ